MAWKFPKNAHAAAQPLDLDQVNENLLATSQEAGRLNEQNWKEGAITDRTDVALDAVYQLASSGTQVDMNLRDDRYSAWDYGTIPSDWFVVLTTNNWQVVETKTVSTDSVPVYFAASFQQISERTMRTGPQYALRVDGAVIPETMTMTGDQSNDPFGANSPVAEYPISLETVFFATEGEHVFELVSRDPRVAKQYSGSLQIPAGPPGPVLGVPTGGVDEVDDAAIYYVVNREIILWEMRR